MFDVCCCFRVVLLVLWLKFVLFCILIPKKEKEKEKPKCFVMSILGMLLNFNL
jgi:hypothetical protein